MYRKDYASLYYKDKEIKIPNWLIREIGTIKSNIKWDGNNVLLFGSEGYGLKYQTLKNTDFILKIDINNNVESLNISNSAAVVFHYIDNFKKK